MAETILIIEDDPILLEAITMELESAGYEVTSVESGEEAIERCSVTSFDVIISDVRLGGMSGLETLAKLRPLLPAARTIVMTGYAHPEAPLQAIKLHVDDYLLKPFDLQELLGSVRNALQRSLAEIQRNRESLRIQGFLTVALDHVRNQPDGERRTQAALRLANGLGFSPQRRQLIQLSSELYQLPERILSELEELRAVRMLIKGALGPSGPIESRLLAVAEAYRIETVSGRGAQALIGRLDLDSKLVNLLLHADETLPNASHPTPEMALWKRRQRLRTLSGEAGAKEARETALLARELDLDREFAELCLDWAERGGEGQELAEALRQADQVLAFWESSQQRLLCQLYLHKLEPETELTWELLDMELLLQRPSLSVPWLQAQLLKPVLAEQLSLTMQKQPTVSTRLLEYVLDTPDSALRKAALELLSNLQCPEAASLLNRITKGPPNTKTRTISEEVNELQVFLLGPMRMTKDGQTLPEYFTTRKVMSLFAFLCSHRGEIQEEGRLADRFWPESSRSRQSLQNGVSQIRKFFLTHLQEQGRDLLSRQRFGYLLQSNALVWVDLEQFRYYCELGLENMRMGRCAEALPQLKLAETLYGGDLLEGLNDDWIDRERISIQRAWSHLLLSLAKHYLDCGKTSIALTYCQKVLLLDPCDEEACLLTLQSLAQEGRINEAVKHYHAYTKTLHQELGLTPSPRAVEAYLRLTING